MILFGLALSDGGFFAPTPFFVFSSLPFSFSLNYYFHFLKSYYFFLIWEGAGFVTGLGFFVLA